MWSILVNVLSILLNVFPVRVFFKSTRSSPLPEASAVDEGEGVGEGGWVGRGEGGREEHEFRGGGRMGGEGGGREGGA